MWAHGASALVGLWVMVSPAVLGFDEPASTSSYVAGPLAVAIGYIAASELGRPLRWANAAVGAWLVVAPWPFGFELVPLVNSVASGAALVALALVRGEVTGRYGGGWSELWR